MLYYNFLPDFADQYAAYLVADVQSKGASQVEIDTMITQGEQMKELMKNPLINAAVSFTEPFPVGLLVTLISAAVLRKQEAA